MQVSAGDVARTGMNNAGPRMTSHGPARVRLGARTFWRSEVSGGRSDAQTGALGLWQAL